MFENRREFRFITSDMGINLYEKPQEHDFFLGRQRAVSEIVNVLKEGTNEKYCYSGLFRNGKTWLFLEARRVIELAPYTNTRHRIIVVYVAPDPNIKAEEYAYLRLIMATLHEKVRGIIPNESECQKHYEEFVGCTEATKLGKKASAYLEYLSDLKYACVLLLDEFQYFASEKSSMEFQELLTLHYLPMCIVYIGRYTFNTTLQKMKGYTSGVYPICDQRTVHGFDDDDIELFKQFFLNEYGCDLKRYMSLIRTNCGRSPYLFADLGKRLLLKLKKSGCQGLSKQWFEDQFNTNDFDAYYRRNMEILRDDDQINGMDNLTRIHRIVIGPPVGIRKEDIEMLKQMGYLESFRRVGLYSISPSFVERLRKMEITGELPTLMLRAEKLLKDLIRRHANEIIQRGVNTNNIPLQTKEGYTWSSLDRAILSLQLTKVPDTSTKRRLFGRNYSLCSESMKKYAEWVEDKQNQGIDSDLLDVLLLKDRLAIVLACWEVFSNDLGDPLGEMKSSWANMFLSWSLSRNPVFHADDIPSELDQTTCEACCRLFIEKISSSGNEIQ